MKLLFIFYTPSGGMETLNRQRAAALLRYGVDCHLLYLEQGAGLHNIEGIRTFVKADDASIGELLRQEQYDAIIVTSNYYLLPRLRQMGFANPIIFEAQGLGTGEWARYVLCNAIPYITGHATAVLCPQTPHLIQLFQMWYSSLPMYIINNCIDSEQFAYVPLPRLSYPVVGWVGRADANKNWRAMADIVTKLIAIFPDMQLWLFEDSYMGDEVAAYETALAQTELAGRIVRHASVPHRTMPEYYSRIGDSGGFLLSTSVTEGFGYAMVEAMCCRCPVLASDSDGNRSFLIHDVTGKMYRQGDIAAALQEASYLLVNPSLRETLRMQARSHIEQHFSPDTYCRSLISMLNQLGVT